MISTSTRAAKAARGANSYHAGRSAELRVAQDYKHRGYTLADERWRGSAGEIDLILRGADGLVFVEVKKSKNFERAIEQLTRKQMQRIYHCAEEYIGAEPAGALTYLRFDVALVDQCGHLRILENAFGHD